MKFLILRDIVFDGFSQLLCFAYFQLLGRLLLITLGDFLFIGILLWISPLLVMGPIEILDELWFSTVSVALVFAWRVGFLGDVIWSEILSTAVGVVLVIVADVLVDLVYFLGI
jgi:hypothetical protein